MKALLFALLVMSIGALAGVATTSEPPLSEIKAAQATTLPEESTSHHKGLAFKRFYQVWLENIDYEDSESDENQEWFASQGILLTNFYAVAHPSEPNYCAAAGGDTFGMDNDKFQQVPENVSTVVDLLEVKNISWAEYQEHSPYPGFQGFNYSNQQTHAPDYVRKHNPLVLYNSITKDDSRARLIKNFTDFEKDLKNEKLPQWAFITPNMTNDAHDTTIKFGASWERKWVEPLLNNSYFMKDTVVLLTYDEDKTYTKTHGNRIFSVLIGGGIPERLKGTKDDTFYTHYSSIATVSANWGLPSLGRWDCGANIFKLVADKMNHTNWDVNTTHLHLNNTYPGPLSDGKYTKFSAQWPNPITEGDCSAGFGVLGAVKKTYNKTTPSHNYTYPFPWHAESKYNLNVTATRNVEGKTTQLVSDEKETEKKESSAAIATMYGCTVLAGALVAILVALL